MTPITVAPVTEAIMEECTHLFVSVFNAEPWNDHWTVERAGQRLRDLFATPGFVGFSATESESGRLVGFAMGHCEPWYDGTHFFYLKEMCVSTALQRRGIGGKLLEALERHLRGSVSLVYLLTMGGGGQTESFYAKHGFSASTEMIMMHRRLG